MPEETVPVEVTPKEIVKYRNELAKVNGSTVFLQALDATLVQAEKIATEGLAGVATWKLAAKTLLDNGIQGDEDYARAIALANEAGSKTKRTEDRFEIVTNFFYRFHRALTGLRGAGTKPWEETREKLSNAAGKWYLESKRAKEEMERKLADQAGKDQLALAEEAEDLILAGQVKEGQQKLAEARMTMAPILPEAVPKVDNSRIKEGYEGTCTDITALGQAIFKDQCTPLMWQAFNKDGSLKWERPLMVVDQTVLNEIVSRQGKSLNIPGIKVEETASIGALKL